MLSVGMLNVIMPSVVMLNVVVPFWGRHDIERNDIQQNDSQQDGVKPNNWLNCKLNFCCLVTIESVIQLNVVTPSFMKSPMRCLYLSY